MRREDKYQGAKVPRKNIPHIRERRKRICIYIYTVREFVAKAAHADATLYSGCRVSA